MRKKLLVLPSLLILLTLTLLLSGCGGGNDKLEGKYIATFELNGGTLTTNTSQISPKVNYAYEPGSLMLDPATHAGYKLTKNGYNFTGWYTSAECLPEEKWDFKTPIESEHLTLYAGWAKKIVYTFTVCYADGENTVTLGSYTVDADSVFTDRSNYADKREGFTPTGYYADAACTTPWDSNTKHPGGEVDTDIRVFVDYIPGKWQLVSNYAQLVNAIGSGNVYLTADIDCNGQEFPYKSFQGIFEGNGHTVSNFTVKKSGSAIVRASIFNSVTAGSEIRNVAFENVTYQFTDVTNVKERRIAALAQQGADCKITDVTIKGKIVTDYEGELSRYDQAFFEEGDTATVTGFTATISIEIQKP